MAKPKRDNSHEDLTFNGQSIDPEIQKKVDQYMDLESVESPSTSPDQPETVNETTSATDSPKTAPLLPTDKLPESIKEPAKKGAKIQVVHADEAEEPAAPNDDEQKADISEKEPEDSVETEPESGEAGDEPVVEDDNADIDPEEAEQPDEEPEPAALTDDETAQLKTTEDETAGEDESVAASDEINEEVESSAGDHSADETANEEVSAVDADTLAAPDFDEKINYEGKTIADLETLPLDDPETAQAVEDIIAADADHLLQIEDAKREERPPVAAAAPKVKKPKKKGNFFKTWWGTPLYRNLTLFLLVAGLVAAALVPSSRYFLLNAAGVKVSASMKVLDEKTSLPLKNVEMSVGNVSSKSDSDGNVKLEGIPLGSQTLVIKKPAFADVSKNVTLGWGSNPLGEVKLTPIGNQYVIVLSDFLSGKPITDGEVSFEEATARLSDKGEAILTVPNIKEEEITITVNAKDYRTEQLTVSTQQKQDKYELALVPSRQHVFFSKRSGKVDLYKADVDGKNEEIILNGTGLERDDSLAIAPHPTRNLVAFSSSRENVRNKDGYLLNTLQLIDLESKEVIRVAQSERIQVIDWIGDKLVFVRITEGASEASTNRHRLLSFDAASRNETELASTNYFNDVLSVNGSIYYSPALYQVNGTVGLYKINPDGTNKKTIFQKEVWNLFRTSFDKVSMSVGQDWYEMNLATDNLTKVGGAPSVLKSRVYVASPDGKQSLWIDERDGKSVLVSYQHETKEDKVVLSENGIKNPVRWLDNEHVVYRVANGQETADYVLSVRGGQPKKIADVTNSVGIDRWYYF